MVAETIDQLLSNSYGVLGIIDMMLFIQKHTEKVSE